MSLEETLNVTGSWLVANCGDLPSQRGCKLVIMSPMDHKEKIFLTRVCGMPLMFTATRILRS